MWYSCWFFSTNIKICYWLVCYKYGDQKTDDAILSNDDIVFDNEDSGNATFSIN